MEEDRLQNGMDDLLNLVVRETTQRLEMSRDFTGRRRDMGDLAGQPITLAFITAVGALEAGEDVSIVLLAEAAYLAKPGVVDSIHGVGFAPLKEYVQKVVDAKIDVYV